MEEMQAALTGRSTRSSRRVISTGEALPRCLTLYQCACRTGSPELEFCIRFRGFTLQSHLPQSGIIHEPRPLTTWIFRSMERRMW